MKPVPHAEDRYRNIVDLATVTYLYPSAVVNGRPVIDCSAEFHGDNLFLPMVNGTHAVHLRQVGEGGSVANLRWEVADLVQVDQVVDTTKFHVCGQALGLRE